ncbi:hypothetical protein QF000_002001 [Paraburkholderia atlantica]|uniref:Uncharacterized protein n=1 Tax=Paraburkholderia atlantica TaxID=2654982 RepID=A0A6I1PLV7_PARAM|nr:hypothetical protein [Paraburkholderia atlantica]MBB5423629.1 hypothetical protein [Paraburkholderia atlantica]MPW05117.1 hypothetical protein [Paraburkholderia atlantica]NUY29324.1 hypothetical protein [Paraburkholderia atlantica]
MRLIAFVAASVCWCSSAWAGQPAAGAPATAATSASLASADKVYPPLPTLAMLPPSTGDDDDLPAARSTSRNKKKTQKRDCHCAMPTPRLVVSDESRAYLKDIERQLDSALAQ